jgi:hypothetical protein
MIKILLYNHALRSSFLIDFPRILTETAKSLVRSTLIGVIENIDAVLTHEVHFFSPTVCVLFTGKITSHSDYLPSLEY